MQDLFKSCIFYEKKKKMKKWFIKKMNFVIAAMLALLIVFSSCNDDEYYYVPYYSYVLPNALVTVKSDTDQAVFLQLDDNTTLKPVNMPTSPFGNKEVRALMNAYSVDADPGKYSQAVYVNWIDSILTKPIAKDLGENNDNVYGTDPVDILNDWVTIAEDGYLTLRFVAPWTKSAPAHYVNLLLTNNPKDPYELKFYHNAYGDMSGEMASGIVAFNLSSLPDTNGKTVKLTLKWKSFDGEKTKVFDYCTRKSTSSETSEIAVERSVIKMY